MNRLSEAEQEALLDVLRDVESVGIETGTWEQGKVLDAVEAIVAARLASVEALADKWQAEAQGRSSHAMHVLWDCGDDLRAVLGSDAHTEQHTTQEDK